jgi:hypothetical protein
MNHQRNEGMRSDANARPGDWVTGAAVSSRLRYQVARRDKTCGAVARAG